MSDLNAEHAAIVAALVPHMGAAGVGGEVSSFERLTGGASRETFRFNVSSGLGAGRKAFILQRERGGTQRQEGGMAREAEVISAAAAAGVPVPSVVVANDPAATEAADELGPSWFVTEAVAGETIARKLLRDDDYDRARSVLARQLGAALGAVHAVPAEELPWLDRVDEVQKYREIADELGLTSPAFEIAFRWLDQHRPDRAEVAVVHGDFRMGNLIVDQDGLAAVIDWELAHLGDPMEDLGWLCVRAWRFGGNQPVAGVGSYDDLFAGYEEVTGVSPDLGIVRWWQILGSLKWGVMCAIQAEAHRSGVYRSVELAAIGRRISEQEHDLVELIGQELR